jgi:hypothetical protein
MPVNGFWLSGMATVLRHIFTSAKAGVSVNILWQVPAGYEGLHKKNAITAPAVLVWYRYVQVLLWGRWFFLKE